MLLIPALQGEAEHISLVCDAPVAGAKVARDRSLGRGPDARTRFATLRGTGSGHYDVRQGSQQVRHVGASGRGSGF